MIRIYYESCYSFLTIMLNMLERWTIHLSSTKREGLCCGYIIVNQ